MANTIGTAYIQIEPTTEGISGKISSALGKEATSAGTSVGGKLSNAIGAAKAGLASVAALGAAAVATGGALVSSASATAEYGDNIDKMSQKLGVSAQFYQEWDAVLQHSGTSIDGMTASFKKLATSAQDGGKKQQEAFEALGLSMDQVASMSTEDLFASVVSGLQNMEEGTERTTIATTLLGKGAMEMGALLNTSAEDTQAMIDAVHELGGVMSDDAVKNAAAFQDSLQDMQTSFAGVKNSVMAELLPSFTSIMDGISGLMTGSDEASSKLSEGVKGLVESITNAIPAIAEVFSTLLTSLLEVAPELISTLASGIVDNLPELIPAIVELVVSIGEALIENLPMLIEAGLQIILQLAMSISQALPTLIPTIVEVVLQIVESLIDNIDMLVDAAIALMMGLAEGLINALPVLIEKTPEIIVKLVEAIIRNAPKILEAAIKLIVTLAEGLMTNLPKLLAKIPELMDQLKSKFIELVSKFLEVGRKVVDTIKTAIQSAWSNLVSIASGLMENLRNAFFEKIQGFADIGENIIEGIKNGLTNGWETLKSYVSDLASSLLDAAKSALGIHSPSKLFADIIGYNIPAGVAKGIKNGLGLIDDAIEGMTDRTLTDSSILTTASTYKVSGSESTAKSIGGYNQTVNIYSPTALSPYEVARQTRNSTRNMVLALRGV
ncbi:MAG: hypothetical protein Q4A15_00420 [Prevotellaceae bacterium]|nr:hypothetical protein [Prevotellaceae bacterium]